MRTCSCVRVLVSAEVCVCVGSMCESVRGQRKRKTPGPTPWQQQPNHRTSKRQKSRTTRKIKSACRQSGHTLSDRRGDVKVKEERKLKRKSTYA